MHVEDTVWSTACITSITKPNEGITALEAVDFTYEAMKDNKGQLYMFNMCSFYYYPKHPYEQQAKVIHLIAALYFAGVCRCGSHYISTIG